MRALPRPIAFALAAALAVVAAGACKGEPGASGGAGGGLGGGAGAGGGPGCVADADCSGQNGDCSAGRCFDGVCGHDNEPIGAPCDEDGGKVCDGAGTCVGCMKGEHCASAICLNHQCAPSSCADGIMNAGESDID